MGKQRARTTSWKNAFFFVAAVAFLLPVGIVYANSGPPPSVAWFLFDYTVNPSPRFQGIQLIACTTTECTEPVLLQQFGTCDGSDCLTSPPALTGGDNDFACAANVCRSSAFPDHGGTDFKLVVQFSDRVRVSEVTGKLPTKYGQNAAWRVVVQETDLSLKSSGLPAVSNPDWNYSKRPIWQFGLSILVELVVAGLFIEFLLKGNPASFEGRLWIVLLVNLLSLPVVWFFFLPQACQSATGTVQAAFNRRDG